MQKNKDRDIRILHPHTKELYHYSLGVRFDPGALAEGFRPLFQLPILFAAGRSRIAAQKMRPLQPAQVWFSQQRGINGLGGVQHGTFVLQPLLDPAQFGDQGE